MTNEEDVRVYSKVFNNREQQKLLPLNKSERVNLATDVRRLANLLKDLNKRRYLDYSI